MKLTSTILRFSKIFLFFTLMLQLYEAKAQYSYAGFHLGYTWENLEKGNNFFSSENYSRINELTATFSFLNRPIRRVGLGANISIPVVRGFRWTFDGSPTTGGSSYSEQDDNSFGASSPEYAPTEYDYKVQNRLGITLIGRLYFSDESTWYFDLRYTFSSVNESFIFERSASNGVAARSINYNENISARGPGFEIGGLAQFDDHFYLNYGFIMDFIAYEESSFEYNIEFESASSGEDPTVKFESKIQEDAFKFQFYYGIGYRF